MATIVRRMPKRFLDNAPEQVYDIFDNPETHDRYTVVLKPYEHRLGTFAPYLGASENPFSPQGFGISDEMPVHQLRAYRDRNRRFRMNWNGLPEDVKTAVKGLIADVPTN